MEKIFKMGATQKMCTFFSKHPIFPINVLSITTDAAISYIKLQIGTFICKILRIKLVAKTVISIVRQTG